ncbi:MAG: GNAT family N-acetyltransferase [Candidatus Lokiarchaeota archaeon]|nr:GNAT family N-acetyltransferase [Candidatus Lokiarchaeota archaeon]
MKYLIRKAKPKDAKGIHEIFLAAFEEFRYFYSPEGFADTVMSEKAVVERIKNMSIYIAVDKNEEITGTIGWKKVNNKEGHIRGMAVHPRIQGKDSPAIDLLKKVESDGLSQGCTFLTLDTTEVLQRAQNFYRKNGFTKTGKTGNFFGATIYEFAKKISSE